MVALKTFISRVIVSGKMAKSAITDDRKASGSLQNCQEVTSGEEEDHWSIPSGSEEKSLANPGIETICPEVSVYRFPGKRLLDTGG